MNQLPASIRDRVEVRPHPTVVRLDDLESGNAAWVTQSFVLTSDLENHLKALRHSFNREYGCGVFLIGHYGSGKSHFLAFLVEQLRSRRFVRQPVSVAFLSLVNYRSDQRLEDIVARLLKLETSGADRRNVWKALLECDEYRAGLVLVLDEVSEFLRSKDDDRSFTEDIRFLQFLGEWAQNHRLWIVAAIQEAIEHTGELEYSLYRKIKDRYPLRLLLTPTHVHALIADSILEKKPGYEQDVGNLLGEIRASFPGIQLDYELFKKVYPLHPATLDLLDEVRDRFSQARGIVDFTVKRLGGDAERGIPAFLDQPWGSLLSPDVIVDHFSDLFELQPEFMPLAQQVLPWYRKNLPEIFENPGLRNLAGRVLKLLILVYLSPARDELSSEQAAEWLLFNSIRSDPSKNRAIVHKVLSRLAEQGRYVAGEGSRFKLNLKDDSRVQFDKLLNREIERLQSDDLLILDTLVSLMNGELFNPFILPGNRWQNRRVAWHFHEREYALWFGEEQPGPNEGIAFCVRLPWGKQTAVAGLYTIEPATIAVTVELRELAALVRLNQQALSPEIKKLVERRLQANRTSFVTQLRNAYSEAVLITPEGNRERAPRIEKAMNLERWLESLVLLILRRTYPAFERFAPAHGPLPREAWSRFMRFAGHDDIANADADDYVRLIREAYLLPMGLLRRKGRDYVVPGNLDSQELVRLLMPMLKHSPSPKAIHQRLSEPVYGLVPDQINLLLVFMLLQGEIELLKDQRSYRDTFETLENPLHYDRVELGHALPAAQLGAITRLCEALNLKLPQQWTVLAQKRALENIREAGRQQADQLQPLLKSLHAAEQQGAELSDRLVSYLQDWNALQKGSDLLKSFQDFLASIESLDQFINQIRGFSLLQRRLPAMIEELHRYRHLFANSLFHEKTLPNLTDAGPELPEAPALAWLDDLEAWLAQARTLYAAYKKSYGEAHQQWWQSQRTHPALNWQPPLVAVSQHIGLGDTVKRIRELQQRAARQRCRGLVNLDYQPLCSCGFDGESAPFANLIDECEKLQQEAEAKLESFFQQDQVKEAIGAWRHSADPTQADLTQYLSGSRVIPEIRDLSWFDRNLSGDAILADVDVSSIVALIEDRVWVPEALQKALNEHLGRYAGRRIRFIHSQPGSESSEELISWCAEQCLRFGVRLPERMAARHQNRIQACLRSEWVSDAAVKGLEQLGLSTGSVDKILGWLINGQLALPDLSPRPDCVLFAVRELLFPESTLDPRGLALRSESLYRVHNRFAVLAGKRWLDRLDELAKSPLDPNPKPLIETLEQNLAAQWLLLDCWGLPLMRPLMKVIETVFEAWKTERTDFGLVNGETTTDSYYRQLLNGNICHPFEKCNVIDRTLHDRDLEFSEFVRIVETELAIALKRLAAKLDLGRDLLIFADHGFRLDPSGRKFQHGGPSMLERVVPVCLLCSREKV
ncbi:MAG: DUF6079 family protein [Methylococcaceae bacterium]|nr:DUF6079 family protein [Methylococcaceae bacterium]